MYAKRKHSAVKQLQDFVLNELLLFLIQKSARHYFADVQNSYNASSIALGNDCMIGKCLPFYQHLADGNTFYLFAFDFIALVTLIKMQTVGL